MATTKNIKKFSLTEDQNKTIFDNEFYGTGLLRVKIGKKDINGIDIKSGDVVEVIVCKEKLHLSQSEVKHVGVIAFKKTAFCVILESGTYYPIINYADYCSFTIIGAVNDVFSELTYDNIEI